MEAKAGTQQAVITVNQVELEKMESDAVTRIRLDFIAFGESTPSPSHWKVRYDL